MSGKHEGATHAICSSCSQNCCCCCLQLLTCCKLLTVFESDRGEWEKIGTVVGGPGEDTVAAGSQFHEGQQYDFVFDVDVADGMPPLKLPVNKGDNPYVAADK